VITSHGPDIMEYNESNKYHKDAHKAAEGCKKIIAISNNNKKRINDIYSECKDKIVSMPNGYNPNLFYREKCDKKDLLEYFNIHKKYDKIICFAGRLVYNKGVDILLNSAKIYEKDNVLTLIVGDGSEYQALNILKEKLGLKNVMFVGNQDAEVTKEVGTLIEKEDIKGLAKEIQKVLKGERNFDKNYLQDYAKNNYSQEMLINKLLQLYEEIMEE